MKRNQPTIKHILAAAGIAALLPVVALAQSGPDAPGHCHRGMDAEHRHGEMGEAGSMPPFLQGVELTEAQRDAVFNILHNQAPVVRDKQKALHKALEALHVLTLSDGKYDEAKSRSLAQEIADNSAALALLRSHAEHEVYALLTPEQRKQVGERRMKDGFHPAIASMGKARHEARAL